MFDAFPNMPAHTPARPALELDALKTRQHATWASGDYAVVGTTLQIVGETLCETADVRSGERVLDVATGNGNAALAAARRFARTTGVDYVPALLDKAAQRARAEGLALELIEADAEALPFDDASFDSVLVFHTLTYTERPEVALRECARVTRPGGRVVALCLDEHRQQHLTARHGERHPGLSPKRVRAMLVAAGLTAHRCEVASREQKKPHFQVVLAVGEKPRSVPQTPPKKKPRT